ncbi:hypothetical protein [Segetibacter aerophilus]|uniref:PsbP C-terminal domain-containing protein n=1 Tax=Segetibacter aerophilus TaxID=670293 RepID=A0A512B8K9_9BACT|nr:hypothetical protein [Segetibacter aerophilus]GEO08290.1 hypothetical protein SAE01_07860 [Segetibacter aerophilus]
MKIKMFYPCSWTQKVINDTRTVKNFTSSNKDGSAIISNLILIPTPSLLNKEQFEFAMSTSQLKKMMNKGEVKAIQRLQFDNFEGAEILVKTETEGYYSYSFHYYMYSNKGLMVLNYFVGSQNDTKASAIFNQSKSLFRELAKKTTLLNPLPNQGVTVRSSKPTYQEWVKANPTDTDKSSSNAKIEGSLYRNTKYSFRIRFIDNWEIRKGDSKLTVIKSVQSDSGKSFLVLVSDYPSLKLKDGEITDKQLQEDKKNAIQICRAMNMELQHYKIVKGYLNNFPASIATFSANARSQTKIVAYKYKHISCFKKGLLYNLTISMPSVFWTSEEDKRIDRVIESLVFEENM